MPAIRFSASGCPLAFTSSAASRTGAVKVAPGFTGGFGLVLVGGFGVVTPGFTGGAGVFPGIVGVVGFTAGFSPGFKGLVLSLSFCFYIPGT